MTYREQTKGWSRIALLALLGFIMLCSYLASCLQEPR